ncbi:MAG: FAD:protein FMN transferase [Clostridiales bacterium]|nr:FAD:protein FMN transferase [Clostridiales bacterium]
MPTLNKFFAALTAVLFFCAACDWGKPRRYQAEFDGLFDTHAEIVGYAKSEAEFMRYASKIYDEVKTYSELFDIYKNYDGISNLKTVNDNAGIAPVAVDEKIIKFLLKCKELYAETDYTVNIAMGSVLSLWHERREEGTAGASKARLPDMPALRAAADNTDITRLVIDEDAGTVFLSEKGMSLDVGAIAKGYAASMAVREAAALGMTSMLVNMGGNIIAVGQPLDGARNRWGVGIQDPARAAGDVSNILDTVFVNDCALVTSGDYQRYYMVDGKAYGHIIDPGTLMPAERYASVTIIHQDSGLADALSTALFILPEERGEALLRRYGAEALWVYRDGSVRYTEGYRAVSKTYGGASSAAEE